MQRYELEQKISVVAESFELLGMRLLSDMTKKSSEYEIAGYADLAKHEAERRKEFSIAERMRSI